MLIVLLAYLGGVLTIASPCILPVLPFVFARSGQSFWRGSLPMLLGMALTFALVATLAAVGGGWAVAANQWGRFAALVLLAGFGLILLFPALGDRLTQPLVALGGRLSAQDGTSVWSSAVLGVATGLLWAPCAGPILGLILTGAALNGASLGTTFLLLAYAAGAATSLALALLVGGRVFKAMKRSLGFGENLRRVLGAVVLVAVAAIAAGVDTGFLTRASLAGTASLEQGLLDKLRPASVVMPKDGGAMSGTMAMSGGAAMSGSNVMKGAMTGTNAMTGAMTGNGAMMAANVKSSGLPVEGRFPGLDGATTWLNSAPLTAADLKGKVVLVDFWTYSCINCLRALPYVEAWAQKYKDQGLVVIGVHAPEFAFEKDLSNVTQAVKDLGVTYPVALDNDYAIWRAFGNEYWPAHYFIDATGRIRHHHFGEGSYDESEKVIQDLLAEAGHPVTGAASVKAEGVQAAADAADVQSPETYIGHARASGNVNQGGLVQDTLATYAPATPALNQWSLSGPWTVAAENATAGADAALTFRFHARDLHLVLGSDKPVRFTVTIDGHAPGADHGMDVDETGAGTLSGQRLYQLIRQSGPIADHTFEIRFADPGAAAFAFTFG